MINVLSGDVLKIDKGFIVHGCNVRGVMGAGIAAQIKKQYPTAYDIYRHQYEADSLRLGSILPVLVGAEKWIVNAMTQDLLGYPNSIGYGVGKNRAVSYDALEESFDLVNTFVLNICEHSNQQMTVSFPQIGAGLGGGDWNIISQIIDSSLDDSIVKTLYMFKG